MNGGDHASRFLTHRVLMLAVLLLAFALRCSGLDVEELRGDEAFGYFFSLNRPWAIVEQTLELGEPHPVASYWLQHGWLALAGHSEFALRFLGVCWSVLAVALMRPLAGSLGLASVNGVVAAALLALSPYAIWHSQDARMYSMSLALTMASTLLAVCWWKAKNRTRALCLAAAYLVVTWLALQTHYFALYIVAAHFLALAGWAVVERAWHKLTQWVLCGLVLLLLWLPWLWAARDILLDYHGNGDSPGLAEALVRAFGAFLVGESASGEWRVAWAVLAIAAFALGALVQWQTAPSQTASAVWFLLVYALVPLAATWWSSLTRPIFNERYLVAAVPPVYLLIAAAVQNGTGGAWPRERVGSLAWAVVGLVLVAMVSGYVQQRSDPAFSKSRGWRQLASSLSLLTEGVAPGRVRLAQNYPDPTLWYYYRGDVPHLVLPPASHSAARATEEVKRMASAGVERVVLVEQPTAAWDDQGIAGKALAERYTLAARVHVAAWPVSVWLHPGAELVPLDVAYERGLQLRGAQIIPEVALPGGLVAVHLAWHIPHEVAVATETVSVQILNGAGELVAQSDRVLEPAAETVTLASYAILLPVPLAAGDYQVAVVVYDPDLPGAPRRLTVEGADMVRIGTVAVISSK